MHNIQKLPKWSQQESTINMIYLEIRILPGWLRIDTLYYLCLLLFPSSLIFLPSTAIIASPFFTTTVAPFNFFPSRQLPWLKELGFRLNEKRVKAKVGYGLFKPTMGWIMGHLPNNLPLQPIREIVPWLLNVKPCRSTVGISPIFLLVRSLSICLFHYRMCEFFEVASASLQLQFESNCIWHLYTLTWNKKLGFYTNGQCFDYHNTLYSFLF